jgi:hypothetical protein
MKPRDRENVTQNAMGGSRAATASAPRQARRSRALGVANQRDDVAGVERSIDRLPALCAE